MPALLDNVQDRDPPHAEDVDEEILQASIQKARQNSIAIARIACGAKRAARAAQLPDPDPHLIRELSCNEDLAERSSEGVSDDSEN